MIFIEKGCPNCGRIVDASLDVCPYCNCNLISHNVVNQERRKINLNLTIIYFILLILTLLMFFFVKGVLIRIVLALVAFVVAETITKENKNNLILSLIRIIALLQFITSFSLLIYGFVN